MQVRAKSAMSRKPINIDQELDHQTQKSKILDEDRKNFLRQAE
jgi:Arc/MetJ family transcription regulator